MRKMMKRVSAVMLAGVLTAGMLSGCGSTKDSGGKKGDKIEIRMLTRMAGTTPQVQIYKDVIAEFESKYPEAKVIDESQGDESAFNNKLKTDLASGTLPNIFRIQGVAGLGEYIDSGLLMDMDPILAEDKEWGGGFTEGALEYYRVPGKEGTYGIPMESGLIGVYWNEDLFQKAGIDTFPETWSQFTDAITKLKDSGVIPIALGAKTSYMAGHLHDQIFYKWLGIDAAKQLGAREKSWTDKDVVETLQFVDDLNKMGALPEGAAGISDDIVLSQFQQGEAAMMITGPWNISNFTDKEKCKVADSVRVAKFPYFDEKPEFKNDDMQTLSPYMVNGKLEGREKELTIELLKMLTSKEVAKRFAEEASFLIPRTDIEIDETKLNPLLAANIKLGGTSEAIAVDVCDFDPIASMLDRSRNSIVSMLVGSSADDAAKEIQAEVDKNAK